MRFTIKLKLALAFGVIILMMAGTSIYGIMSLSSLNDAITNLIAGPAARLERAQELGRVQLRIARSQMNMATATNSADVARSIETSDVSRKEFTEIAEWLTNAATSEEGKAQWR